MPPEGAVTTVADCRSRGCGRLTRGGIAQRHRRRGRRRVRSCRHGRQRRTRLDQPAVDQLDGSAIQIARGQPQRHDAVQVAVLGLRVVGVILQQCGARGQNIDHGLGADLVAGLGGLQRNAVGFDRLPERLHLSNLADDPW